MRPLEVPGKIWLDADFLCWEPLDVRKPDLGLRDSDSDPRKMLHSFIGITDSSGALRFAEQFGALGLCKHGWPFTHNNPYSKTMSSPFWESGCLPTRREPIKRWLHYVQQAQALLRIGERLRNWNPGLRRDPKGDNQRDWELVFADANPNRQVLTRQMIACFVKRVTFARRALARTLSGWLMAGSLHVQCCWEYDAPRPHYVFGGNVFGLLAMQLTVEVCGSKHWVVCDGCAQLYSRDRKPQSGRSNYCKRCVRLGIAVRQRKQRFLAKARRANE